jgi:hypothetical protein
MSCLFGLFGEKFRIKRETAHEIESTRNRVLDGAVSGEDSISC